jgi:hypothetical protein
VTLAEVEEALVQAAYGQISAEKSLTVVFVSGWGGARAMVPAHWRAEATERAMPYIRAAREAWHE